MIPILIRVSLSGINHYHGQVKALKMAAFNSVVPVDDFIIVFDPNKPS